jgi:hypothetical protein
VAAQTAWQVAGSPNSGATLTALIAANAAVGPAATASIEAQNTLNNAQAVLGNMSNPPYLLSVYGYVARRFLWNAPMSQNLPPAQPSNAS